MHTVQRGPPPLKVLVKPLGKHFGSRGWSLPRLPCVGSSDPFQAPSRRTTRGAFEGTDGSALPGPVFIHRDACEPWSGEGFPPELRPLSLMLESYGAERTPVARQPVRDGAVEDALACLFADPSVAYVHVRNAEAGCYVARVERAWSVSLTEARRLGDALWSSVPL